jgi:hypothetical protein
MPDDLSRFISLNKSNLLDVEQLAHPSAPNVFTGQFGDIWAEGALWHGEIVAGNCIGFCIGLVRFYEGSMNRVCFALQQGKPGENRDCSRFFTVLQ